MIGFPKVLSSLLLHCHFIVSINIRLMFANLTIINRHSFNYDYTSPLIVQSTFSPNMNFLDCVKNLKLYFNVCLVANMVNHVIADIDTDIVCQFYVQGSSAIMTTQCKNRFDNDPICVLNIFFHYI
mgnify:CR=1 FL=1